jgi:hypothetical protein
MKGNGRKKSVEIVVIRENLWMAVWMLARRGIRHESPILPGDPDH